MISTAAHPIDPTARQTPEFGERILMDNTVWIGGNVSIVLRVSIGNNTLTRAGILVHDDIPSNVVAAGNPGKVIKME